MHAYEVGKPYVAGRINWPETVQYNWRGNLDPETEIWHGEHELTMFLASPRAQEVEAIRKGPSSFALVESGDVIMLLYRFRTPKLDPAIDWSDAPYSIWRLTENERIPPPRGLAANQRVPLNITLVDARTGIIKALRLITWSPEFTAAMHGAILDQLARPYPGDAAYQAQIDQLYDRYGDSVNLLEFAQHRTEGGS